MSAKVIAIDGPAASGKSSVAAKVASELGIAYINTGGMYRAVAWFMSNHGFDLTNIADNLTLIEMKYVTTDSGEFMLQVNGTILDEELRTPEVTELTSLVAAIPAVREWLRLKQRAMAEDNWIVMEGRDIGTAVFPDACKKFFLTASPLERARRRLAQEGGKTLEAVAKAISERDYQDSTRAVAPLKMAEDAIKIDSTNFQFEETVATILAKINRHESSYRVPYADTDQMGVVYYANYLVYFERSRTEMLRSLGLSYAELEKMGFFLPVSEVSCHYKGSARYDDLLTFRSHVESMRGARLAIYTEVCLGDKILVHGTVTLGCVDSEHKLKRLPKELVTACSIVHKES